jgi:hypothetical protein
MKTRVDPHLRAEARRLAFRFACDDCAHFSPETPLDPGRCSLGFIAAPRRGALDADEVELCKAFELV